MAWTEMTTRHWSEQPARDAFDQYSLCSITSEYFARLRFGIVQVSQLLVLRRGRQRSVKTFALKHFNDQ